MNSSKKNSKLYLESVEWIKKRISNGCKPNPYRDDPDRPPRTTLTKSQVGNVEEYLTDEFPDWMDHDPHRVWILVNDFKELDLPNFVESGSITELRDYLRDRLTE